MVFKRAILALFCSHFGAATALHATSLAWDPSTTSGLLQYKIYERLPSGYVLLDTVDPSLTTYDLPPLSPGVHIFAVTAVSALMESRPTERNVGFRFWMNPGFYQICSAENPDQQ